MGKTRQANNNQNKAGVPILIWDKKVTRSLESHFIMTKSLISGGHNNHIHICI